MIGVLISSTRNQVFLTVVPAISHKAKNLDGTNLVIKKEALLYNRALLV